MKTIWFINEYAGSSYHGMEFRHYYLGRELVKRGYKVYIITASYSHLFYNLPKIENSFKLEKIDGINYLWVKVPKYQNSYDKRRVLKWLIFTFKTYFSLPVEQLEKPNYIVVSPMATFPVVTGLKWKKKFKAKLIFEVKDIWPLTLVELGGYSWNHPFIKLMRFFELLALKKADKIVSVLYNYGEYLKNIGINRDWCYIPNGVPLKEYKEEELPKEVLKLIPKGKFIVGYTGSIGTANALHYLIEAAKLLKSYKNIVFLIVGKGSEKDKLIHLVKSYKLNNVIFLSPLKKGELLTLLKKFIDVAFIGLVKKKIFTYGVSPNKLFDYMYAKKPIIHAIDTEKDLVLQANCGISVPAENPKAIANAVLRFYKMSPEERKKLGENGYNFLLKNHTYEKLSKKFLECIK